jgi:hypothetical protein
MSKVLVIGAGGVGFGGGPQDGYEPGYFQSYQPCKPHQIEMRRDRSVSQGSHWR